MPSRVRRVLHRAAYLLVLALPGCVVFTCSY